MRAVTQALPIAAPMMVASDVSWCRAVGLVLEVFEGIELETAED